jgi:hypothetical protein
MVILAELLAKPARPARPLRGHGTGIKRLPTPESPWICCGDSEPTVAAGTPRDHLSGRQTDFITQLEIEATNPDGSTSAGDDAHGLLTQRFVRGRDISRIA